MPQKTERSASGPHFVLMICLLLRRARGPGRVFRFPLPRPSGLPTHPQRPGDDPLDPKEEGRSGRLAEKALYCALEENAHRFFRAVLIRRVLRTKQPNENWRSALIFASIILDAPQKSAKRKRMQPPAAPILSQCVRQADAVSSYRSRGAAGSLGALPPTHRGSPPIRPCGPPSPVGGRAGANPLRIFYSFALPLALPTLTDVHLAPPAGELSQDAQASCD